MTSWTAKVGASIVIALLIVAIFAPCIAPQSPYEYHLDNSFAPPSSTNLLGADAEGRDILSRIIYGARVSLGIGASVVLISFTLGTILGLISGYRGGIIDRVFSFACDVFLAFPGFLFAIAVAAFLRPTIGNVILILCIKGWVTYSRLVRGQVLSLKEREFILAGRAIGVGSLRMYIKHLIPNMVGPLAVAVSFDMAGVIMVESSLSFLGLGVPVTIPSWGSMLDQGTRYLLIAPHLSIFPGFAIMLIVLGFNFLGDGLRDYLAPRGR